jgi:hypothetical protein
MVLQIFHILKQSAVTKGCKLYFYALKFIGVSNRNTVSINRSILQFTCDKSKILLRLGFIQIAEHHTWTQYMTAEVDSH